MSRFGVYMFPCRLLPSRSTTFFDGVLLKGEKERQGRRVVRRRYASSAPFEANQDGWITHSRQPSAVWIVWPSLEKNPPYEMARVCHARREPNKRLLLGVTLCRSFQKSPKKNVYTCTTHTKVQRSFIRVWCRLLPPVQLQRPSRKTAHMTTCAPWWAAYDIVLIPLFPLPCIIRRVSFSSAWQTSVSVRARPSVCG